MSTTPVPDEIRQEVTIEVERERVWAALTEADQLKGWFPRRTPVSICDPAASSSWTGAT